MVALTLAILCLLGVLAFHFPQYLTTPELRQQYSPDLIRHILFAALVVAGSISVLNVLFKRRRGLNAIAGALVLASLALGGSHVPVADFPKNTACRATTCRMVSPGSSCFRFENKNNPMTTADRALKRRNRLLKT